MNKALRHEMKMLRYKKRMKVLLAKAPSIKQYLNGDSIPCNQYALRTTGKPCSCSGCSPYKYNRNEVKKETVKLIDFDLNYYDGELVFNDETEEWEYDLVWSYNPFP